MMGRAWALVAFLALVVGGGLLIGLSTAPAGPWYRGLVKPSFNPPNWVFGPVWTMLYVMIGVAGWRTWLTRSGSAGAGGAAPDPSKGWARPIRLWWLQLALNFAWSPAFFGMQRPGLALAIILPLLATIVGFMVVSVRGQGDRIAGWLFFPYAIWVAFATLLNAAIVALN